MIAAAAACAAPVLAAGDGALDSGARCGGDLQKLPSSVAVLHKISNVLAALPKSAHQGRGLARVSAPPAALSSWLVGLAACCVVRRFWWKALSQFTFRRRSCSLR